MRFESRKYQKDCVFHWLRSFNKGLNPLVAVPTGAGKTVIVCELLKEWFNTHPESKILILSHTQEIIKQDYDAMLEYFPPFGLGIYSAGLGIKEVKKITLATVQSVFRKANLFRDVDMILIDEAHAINHADVGMYRKLFAGMPQALIGGMTATIYRQGHGYIHRGKDAIFNDLAYDLTSLQNFNDLVRDGYLTRLLSKAPNNEWDSSNVKRTGADYNIKDLSKVHDIEETTREAVKETIRQGKNYKKWLVFCIDTKHAKHVARCFTDNGIKADELHTKMPKDRETVIDTFKYGDTRALISVGMVTTGFDAPNIDLIVLLRPTLSTVLHVQMVGRGLRVHPGKDHCLVLDFAGNTLRIGPINNPIIPKKKKKGKGEAPAKKCPVCKAINFAAARFCVMCNHEFVFRNKLTTRPSTMNLIQGKIDKDGWMQVEAVMYNVHHKQGKPDSLKVTYKSGIKTYSEWVCLNHSMFAKARANKWTKRRFKGHPEEYSTNYVYRHRDKLRRPTKIKVRLDGPYPEIKDFQFDDLNEPQMIG